MTTKNVTIIDDLVYESLFEDCAELQSHKKWWIGSIRTLHLFHGSGKSSQ